MSVEGCQQGGGGGRVHAIAKPFAHGTVAPQAQRAAGDVSGGFGGAMGPQTDGMILTDPQGLPAEYMSGGMTTMTRGEM